MRRTKEEAMQTRDDVLNAAATIIANQGVGAFTIDAVAREAGVTKGGVLHHFPSKEALLDGLITLVLQNFQARVLEAMNEEPAETPGRWLRAYLRSVVAIEYQDKQLIPALAAVVTADPSKLAPTHASSAHNHDAAMKDGLDPVEATLIRLAADGIVFSRALSLDVLDEATSAQVYERLLERTNPGS